MQKLTGQLWSKAEKIKSPRPLNLAEYQCPWVTFLLVIYSFHKAWQFLFWALNTDNVTKCKILLIFSLFAWLCRVGTVSGRCRCRAITDPLSTGTWGRTEACGCIVSEWHLQTLAWSRSDGRRCRCYCTPRADDTQSGCQAQGICVVFYSSDLIQVLACKISNCNSRPTRFTCRMSCFHVYFHSFYSVPLDNFKQKVRPT